MDDLAITAAGSLQDADPRKRLHRAANQLETLFINQLMKVADEAKLDDDPLLGDDSAGETWKSMLHGAFAERAAGRFGIGEAVERQLALHAGFKPASPATAPGGQLVPLTKPVPPPQTKETGP